MPELLVELLSEEIPARMQARAAEDLCRLLSQDLNAAGLSHDSAEGYATPRRIAAVVRGLPKKQPEITEERKGPRADAALPAVQGFGRRIGVPPHISKQFHDLKTGEKIKFGGTNNAGGHEGRLEVEVRETEKGPFYFAKLVHKARPVDDLLHEILYRVVWNFPWPKSMRWGDYDLLWVRPLEQLLVVYDGRVPKNLAIPKKRHGPPSPSSSAQLDDYVRASNATVGHRFLAPRGFKVRDFADYRAKLAKAKVILDPAERRAEILKQAERRAKRAKLKLKDDPALLDEVAGLVEWPVVLMGRIDAQFMDLPPEVLTTSMRAHQKYLALTDAKGRLANRFLLVANMETADNGKAIVAGNERVLRARLADARFFWDQDRKVHLSSRAPRLKGIVFHAKLGTLDEKVDRMRALATEIADYVPGAGKDRVRSAARLAKADLVTGMVGEFPELQGVMGRYYALHGGEHKEVAQAIAEHYAPLGPNDRCPSAPVSVAVALADKIDTLVGFFAIGERPTGSKDPYALRRAALGVNRLIIENRLRLPLRRIFDIGSNLVIRSDIRLREKAARATGGAHVIAAGRALLEIPGWGQIDRVTYDLLEFIADRLKVTLRDKGVRHDLISAGFAVGGEDDLVRLLARVAALGSFLKTDDGANLLVAYRRAANIVRIEEKRDRVAYDGEVDPTALSQDEERELSRALAGAASAARAAIGAEDFKGAMTALADLRRPVDYFFDKVTVNTDDPALRANRLRLLSRIRATLDRVADFSKIEG